MPFCSGIIAVLWLIAVLDAWSSLGFIQGVLILLDGNL